MLASANGEARLGRLLWRRHAMFWSFSAEATVTVSISQPTTTTVVGNSLSITASISTPYQITSVQAQAGSVVAPLTAKETCVRAVGGRHNAEAVVSSS
jgi:hypothetical protein